MSAAFERAAAVGITVLGVSNRGDCDGVRVEAKSLDSAIARLERVDAVITAARAYRDAPQLEGRGLTDEELSKEERGALSELYRAIVAYDASPE